ncbi:SDR family oxidoreductase [Pseudoflavonifractor phocaeensis]|uniref:SDR family oxidoreductase n=1 Tax=Pseudoflavonifractor phocaeensis TaxID=1870988 RepID=UPI001FAF39CB|nr:SDR family oxidoreductase [Pseudoflavonifractor phocaeensis]
MKSMQTMFDLSGKKAILVGGAGDLGYSMAEALVEAGAECAMIDISNKVYTLAKTLSEGGYTVYPIQADISERAQIEQSYKQALKHLKGQVDILVNAAGIQRRYPSEVFPAKDWDEVLAVNLSAPFFYCQLAANSMIPNGGGKIINVASIQSYCGGVTIPAYVATKGGIGQLTKTLSNDWAAKGINVNAIAPGYMDTQLNTALVADPVRSAEILSRIPQKRWGRGDDMKGITVFLASAASDYVNGTVIPVDGGYLGR